LKTPHCVLKEKKRLAFIHVLANVEEATKKAKEAAGKAQEYAHRCKGIEEETKKMIQEFRTIQMIFRSVLNSNSGLYSRSF